eukprot:TRINITY_DN2685_c0_g1_i1.p1 TRINITY_DN2685_c0_g1~~TRINITY_DN2685_c0_g1_i1.p1  ORF type:complete len:193 (-),score=14.33 TRINITY_DN2685_c0_g1_i1:603-1181(-)
MHKPFLLSSYVITPAFSSSKLHHNKTSYIDTIAAMKYEIVRYDSFEEENDYGSENNFYEDEEDFEKPLYILLGGLRKTEDIGTQLFERLQKHPVLGEVFLYQSKNHVLRERRAFLQQVMRIPDRSVNYHRTRTLSFLLRGDLVAEHASFYIIKDELLYVLAEFEVDPTISRSVARFMERIKFTLMAQCKQNM